MLLAIDRWDLYGAVAYPKSHTAGEVRQLYSWATSRGGVLVNPALAEPFGLTLLEAASCGLPVVATNRGGPVDIIKQLNNGQLVDVSEPRQLSNTLNKVLRDTQQWLEWSESGVANIGKFSWEMHVESYLDVIEAIHPLLAALKTVAPQCDGVIMLDLDHTLIGASCQLPALLVKLNELRQAGNYLLGVCTGRSFDSARALLQNQQVPWDVLVEASGTALHWRKAQLVAVGEGTDKAAAVDEGTNEAAAMEEETDVTAAAEEAAAERGVNKAAADAEAAAEGERPDEQYAARMVLDWDRALVSSVLARISGLVLQPECEQTEFKVCFYVTEHAPTAAAVQSLLRQQMLKARVVCTRHRFLDVLPMQASKGMALRYICQQLGVSVRTAVTAGDSAEDFDMLTGCTRGIVVGNYDRDELDSLRSSQNVFFAETNDAEGILEGLAHYGL